MTLKADATPPSSIDFFGISKDHYLSGDTCNSRYSVALWLCACAGLLTSEVQIRVTLLCHFVINCSFVTMSKTPVTFADARRMSTGQLNKLSKEQLCIALKDAINVHNDDQPVTSVPHTLVSQLKDMIKTAVMELRADLLQNQMNALSDFKKEIQFDIDSLHHQTATSISSLRTEIETDLVQEIEDIDKRKNNVMIFGLPEGYDDTLSGQQQSLDGPKIEKLLETLEFSGLKLGPHHRIGKKGTRPRPIKLTLANEFDRVRLLRSSSKLSSLTDESSLRKVFIKPDLTKRQQDRQKALRAEMKRRNEEGEDVVIRGNKVVNRLFRL